MEAFRVLLGVEGYYFHFLFPTMHGRWGMKCLVARTHYQYWVEHAGGSCGTCRVMTAATRIVSSQPKSRVWLTWNLSILRYRSTVVLRNLLRKMIQGQKSWSPWTCRACNRVCDIVLSLPYRWQCSVDSCCWLYWRSENPFMPWTTGRYSLRNLVLMSSVITISHT